MSELLNTIICFELRQEFLEQLTKREPMPSFPIWSTEFGATYSYKGVTHFSSVPSDLKKP